MKREASADWPCLLTPAPGCYPLTVEHRATERVLHVALRSAFEPNRNIADSLRHISTDYREVDWQCTGAATAAEAIRVASEIRPTLVFMQLQTGGVLQPEDIVQLRQVCDPSVVICNWDGDQHFDPPSPNRQWFADLGRVCDASLIPNTAHPAVYASLGVQHPGYLQIGIDPYIYHQTDPALNVLPVVCLASCYGVALHQRRTSMLAAIKTAFPGAVGVYGGGWGADAYPMLHQTQESAVYAAARAALSISIRNDLPRYSSDRLFRMLASGAVCLVEAFPDMEGVGLIGGVNCLVWYDLTQLEGVIRDVLATPAEHFVPMRQAAAALSRDHTWVARFHELLAIADAVRASRC